MATRNYKHPEFGYICLCECHKDGSGLMHCFPCCTLCYARYINEDGTIDDERLRAWFAKCNLTPDFCDELPPVPPFEKCSIPAVKVPFKKIDVDSIVGCNSMMEPIGKVFNFDVLSGQRNSKKKNTHSC